MDKIFIKNFTFAKILKKKNHTYLKLANQNHNKVEEIHSMVLAYQVNKLVDLYLIHKQPNLETLVKC